MRFAIIPLLALGILHVSPVWGQGVPNKYKPAIAKGLTWLVKQQKADGTWPIEGNESQVTATSLAGLALLAEGSTSAKGAYAEHFTKTVNGHKQTCQTGQRDGLLVTQAEQMAGRYMIPHSHAVLFLASVYEMEAKEDGGTTIEDRINRQRRKEVKKTLERAVAFIAKAQAKNGGWFFTSAQEGHDMDVSLETAWQIQALRAAQQAGIDVPKETLQRGLAYLEKNTGPSGGVNYSSGPRPSERADVTVAALACALKPGDYDAEAPRKWLKRISVFAPPDATLQMLHAAQVRHALGENGYAKLLGKDKGGMQWASYRDRVCDGLIGGAGAPGTRSKPQKDDGSWATRGDGLGTVCSTAVSLIILQLDNEAVPIFRAMKAEAKK